MFFTYAILIFVAVTLIGLRYSGLPAADKWEWKTSLFGGTGSVALVVALAWLIFGIVRGQNPDFNLPALGATGLTLLLFAAIAERKHQKALNTVNENAPTS